MVDVSVEREWSQKAVYAEGFMEWLEDHDNELMGFLDDEVSSDMDWWDMFRRIQSEPTLAYFFYTYLSTLDERSRTLDMAAKQIAEAGTVVMIVGQRGQGKTCLAHQIMAAIKRLSPKKKLVYFGISDTPPGYDVKTMNWNDIPPNSVTFVDEIGVLQFSRDAMTREQVDVVKKIPVIRHGGRSFLIISQQASLTDINWVRALSAIIFLSPAMIAVTDDSKISINEYLKYFMPRKRGDFLYLDNDRLISGTFGVPKWWKKSYSMPYAPYATRGRMYRDAFTLIDQGIDSTTILDYLAIRNAQIGVHTIEWMRICAPSGISSLSDDAIERFVEEDQNKPLQDM